MNREVIGKCPVCDNNLSVTKLTCSDCNTSLEGDFNLCKFCRLSKEQKEFVEIFLKSRGNIKEIEKEMGISYPTVRGKLNQIIEDLGYESKESLEEIDRQSILEDLDRGNISSEEAIKLLKGRNDL